MNPKYLITVLAFGLVAMAVEEPPANATGRENPPLNQAPHESGHIPGRFLLEIGQGLDGNKDVVALRIDSFTGRTWRLKSTLGTKLRADGREEAYSLNHWEECMEESTMEELQKRDEAHSVPGHAEKSNHEPRPNGK